MTYAFPRSAGILLPLASLPSPYGIGTLGKAAHEFAEFLSGAGQTYWQMLPLGPTSFGDSPYQSFSSFAGNPYFIDPDQLAKDGLLTDGDAGAFDWGDNPGYVDYKKLYDSRFALLKLAYNRGYSALEDSVAAFVSENTNWLPDYALFMALKRHFDMRPWYAWEDRGIRLYQADAVKKYHELLQDDVRFFYFIQYLFYRQWQDLRRHCRELGLQIIGDMSIYAAMDSADVWANAGLFRLDKENIPIEIAGVPPDYFSRTGQLWGNPIYRWPMMEKDGFSWWRARIAASAQLFDVIRIDHFRGLESYWHVPYGSDTAVNGKWSPGPGRAFTAMLAQAFPETRFIAEDLGLITDAVIKLRDGAGMPGMAVLSFAFDPCHESRYLPHNLERNCVLYTGTHDNDTLPGWFRSAPEAERAFALSYCGEAKKPETAVIRAGMASCANVFIAQMQDWLSLGSEARTNIPGTCGGNWRWRLRPGEATCALQSEIYSYTKTFSRLGKPAARRNPYAD